MDMPNMHIHVFALKTVNSLLIQIHQFDAQIVVLRW